MTKQDYEALAALLKAQLTYCENWTEQDAVAALQNLARDMAQYMSRNPHFDQAKFLAAAGVS